MRLFFIRHGESAENGKELGQHEHSLLSENGIVQTQRLAERLSNCDIGLILSSPLSRALRTAEIVNETLNKRIHQDYSLKEICRPSELAGKPLRDPGVVAIKKELVAHIQDAAWHYSDEENFFEFEARAQKFIESLKQYKEENLLIVSHHVMIKAILGRMIYGDLFTPQLYLATYRGWSMNNGGITVMEIGESGGWLMTAWNDCAHLTTSFADTNLGLIS